MDDVSDRKPDTRRRTKIVASQMLTSMVNSPCPTRAEVSDRANDVLDGNDAVMISKETTAGRYPAEVVKVLDLTIRETGTCSPWFRELSQDLPPSDMISRGYQQGNQGTGSENNLSRAGSGHCPGSGAKVSSEGIGTSPRCTP